MPFHLKRPVYCIMCNVHVWVYSKCISNGKCMNSNRTVWSANQYVYTEQVRWNPQNILNSTYSQNVGWWQIEPLHFSRWTTLYCLMKFDYKSCPLETNEMKLHWSLITNICPKTIWCSTNIDECTASFNFERNHLNYCVKAFQYMHICLMYTWEMILHIRIMFLNGICLAAKVLHFIKNGPSVSVLILVLSLSHLVRR